MFVIVQKEAFADDLEILKASDAEFSSDFSQLLTASTLMRILAWVPAAT